jgi:hypothetical protein
MTSQEMIALPGILSNYRPADQLDVVAKIRDGEVEMHLAASRSWRCTNPNKTSPGRTAAHLYCLSFTPALSL